MDPSSSKLDGPLLRNVSIQGSSGKLFLKSLKPGDMLKGKVSEILPGNKYVVLVRGRNIVAESNLQLKEGSVYSLRVTTTFPSFSFNVVSDQTKSEPDVRQAVRLLNKLDLPVNNVSKQIALEMAKFDLPLTRENIVAIESFFDKFFRKTLKDESYPHGIRTILYFISKGLPFSGEIASRMEQFFSDPVTAMKTIEVLNLKILMKENFPGSTPEFMKEFEKFSSAVIDKTTGDSDQLIKSIEQFYNRLFITVIESLFSRENTVENLAFMLRVLSVLQKIRLINYKTQFENSLYYLPIMLEIDQNLAIELFYRHRTLNAESIDKIPGFSLHLFVTIGKSPPLHLHVQKKVSDMLNIDIRHPLQENLDLVNSILPEVKASLKKRGFRIIRITSEIADTTEKSYRENLFHPEKNIIRSLNITG